MAPKRLGPLSDQIGTEVDLANKTSSVKKLFPPKLKEKHKTQFNSQSSGVIGSRGDRGYKEQSAPKHPLRSSEERFSRDKTGPGRELSQSIHYPIQVQNVVPVLPT